MHTETVLLTNADLAYLGALIRPREVDVTLDHMPPSLRLEPLRHRIAEARKTCGHVQTYGNYAEHERKAELKALTRRKGETVHIRWPPGLTGSGGNPDRA